jgi:hypothetical protein
MMKRQCVILLLCLLAIGIYSGTDLSANPPQADPGKAGVLTGKVLETMDSGRYTYVLLEQEDANLWVAVPRMSVQTGQEISLRKGIEMKDFESKTLNRTFPKIIFSGGLADQHKREMMKKMGSGGSIVLPKEDVTVKKAPGANAYTVAEIHQKSGDLEGKKVVVRGKVIKISANIMKRNWIHLQDGSGDAKSATHDLVVTSSDLPSSGDVVTVSGTLSRDKDFGRGYRYAVIVEDAKIQK